jgi:F-type H+-transporting ATPase subunit epsilon
MTTMKLEIVTAEGTVYSGEVESIVAPGEAGEIGILPNHAPLLTSLKSGNLQITENGNKQIVYISGGFLEMIANTVTVLADSAKLS